MDHGRVSTPKRSDARYHELSGGPGNRAVLYLAKSRLNLSPDEWEDLLWWEQRTYIEGFHDEGLLKYAGEGDDYDDYVPPEEPDTDGPMPDRKRWGSNRDVDPVGASDSELRGLGITVHDNVVDINRGRVQRR